MREIIISTDSGMDLPLSLIRKYNIYEASMYIVISNSAYADGSVPVDVIYDYYDETKKIPRTSAVNPNDYASLFDRIREEHPGCVIMHLAYSAQTTSSFNNARIAAEEMDDIYLIDTKQASGGGTAFVRKACELVASKKDEVTDYQALADEIAAISDKVKFSFLPGNLDYLKAGGRVSNAAYLGASLLKIRPLIVMQNGILVVARKLHGTNKKIIEQYMTDYVEDNNLSRDFCYIPYSKGATKETLDIARDTVLKLGFKEYEFLPAGLVITCHAGPGGIGLAGVTA